VADEAQTPTEGELLEQLEAELRKLKVSDVLGQTVYTVSSLGWRRLAQGEERNLEEARLAIDAIKALLPLLQGELPEQAVRDFESVVANMQLAYVRAQGESEPPTA
jgi:hypothetical protein